MKPRAMTDMSSAALLLYGSPCNVALLWEQPVQVFLLKGTWALTEKAVQQRCENDC